MLTFDSDASSQILILRICRRFIRLSYPAENMGADDVYGHTYVDVIGRCYKTQTPPKAWIFHYNLRENVGFAFMRTGAEQQIEIEVSSEASKEDVFFVLKGYDDRLFTFMSEFSQEEKKNLGLAMAVAKIMGKNKETSKKISIKDLSDLLRAA